MWRRGALIAPLTLVPPNPVHVNLQLFTDRTAWHICKPTLVSNQLSSSLRQLTASPAGIGQWQLTVRGWGITLTTSTMNNKSTWNSQVQTLGASKYLRESEIGSHHTHTEKDVLTLQFLKRIVHHTLQDIYCDCCDRGSDAPPQNRDW